MYNKIKKYIDTDRVINEDNDYLLKEEYDSLLAIKNSYSDVCEMILDWKTYHAIKRHGATPVDYSYHRAGTMKYGESIVEAITEELLGRIIIDGELNETTYLEEY